MLPKRGLAALAITTVALVLLLTFKTPDETSLGRSGTVAVVEPSSSSATTSPAPTSTAAGGGASAASAATTIDGPVVSTRFGPVQVEIVVADGRLQDVIALQLPTGRQSGQISDWSEPILREEALQAQSANIDIVSGATYTSEAYARSLQAALDEAGLA